jgi:hypothetical protein
MKFLSASMTQIYSDFEHLRFTRTSYWCYSLLMPTDEGIL